MRHFPLRFREVKMGRENAVYEKFRKDYPVLKEQPVWEAFELLLKSCRNGGKILVCGNGGSASDSEHIVGELMKGFLLKRQLPDEEKEKFRSLEGGQVLSEQLQQGIPAISLNSYTSLMTAVGNDTSFDMIFAQQVYAYGQPGDVLIAMTTSGNSANIVEGAKTARVKGMKVLGITGEKESALLKYCDVCFRMPSTETYRVQEYTLPLYHTLCAMLEEAVFG